MQPSQPGSTRDPAGPVVSDALLATLLREQAPCLLPLLDWEERVAEANQAARDLLGNELVGLTFKDLLTTFERDVSAAAAAQDARPWRAVTFTVKAGPPMAVRCLFQAVPGGTLVLGGGSPRAASRLEASILELNADLANRSRELQQANAALAELGRLKDTFLGMAAHDLRSPILGVLTFATFLEEDLGPSLGAEQREQLDLIRASAEMMRHLVEGFLDVALIETGHLRLELAPSRLSEVVDQGVALVAHAARRKQVALRVVHDRALGLHPLDPNRLTQVVVNLVSNAVQHSFPGGDVEISTGGGEGVQWLEVRDHGTGIPPEVQRDLFQAFAGGGARKTAGERSVGLGLSISRLIVEAHGGTIEAASRPERGSSFTVRLVTP